VGSLLGQHRDDARLAVAGAVLFAASFLLMQAFGPDFELPRGSEPLTSGRHSVEAPVTAPAHSAPLLPPTLPALHSSTSP